MLPARHKLGAALVAVVALATLRLVHLEADTPLTAGTGSMGLYVDEGYKTLDARNLYLHGRMGWHADDEFAGVWMKRSFVTQAAHYLAFRLAGAAELATARLVSVLFFLVFLLGYLYATLRDFSTGLFFAGLALLGLMHTLFFFSRVALIELPVITFVYGFLFLLRRWKKPSPPAQIAVAIVVTLFATLAVQPSAAFCLFPVLGGVILALWVRNADGRRWSLIALLAFAAAAAVTALWSGDVLLDRIPRRAPSELRELLLNPLTASSAVLVAAGLFCICHILLTRPRSFFADPYRSSLALLTTLGPLSVSILPYDPLRYYVPFLPAYLLLVLEWLHLRLWTAPMPRRGPWLPAALGAMLLVWPIAVLARAVKLHLLAGRRLEHGPLLSYWDAPPYGEAIVLLVVAALWVFRRTVLTGKPILWALCGLLVVTGLRDLHRIGGFLADPAYQWRQISTAMAEIIPPEASVAGDWAPLFTLGSPTRTLVMSSDFNYPSAERFLRFRPDYFLFSETQGGRRGLESLLAEPRIEVAGPIYESVYAGRGVALYHVRYAASSP